MAKPSSGGIWEAREPPRWGHPKSDIRTARSSTSFGKMELPPGPSRPKWLWPRRGLNGPQIWSAMHAAFRKTAVVHNNDPQRGSNGVRSVPAAAWSYMVFSLRLACGACRLPYLRLGLESLMSRFTPPKVCFGAGSRRRSASQVHLIDAAPPRERSDEAIQGSQRIASLTYYEG